MQHSSYNNTLQISSHLLGSDTYNKKPVGLHQMMILFFLPSQECARLKQQLLSGKQEHEKKMAAYAKEEKEIREENLRLQRRLQLEMERREALCRHLSESESRFVITRDS